MRDAGAQFSLFGFEFERGKRTSGHKNAAMNSGNILPDSDNVYGVVLDKQMCSVWKLVLAVAGMAASQEWDKKSNNTFASSKCESGV